MRSARVPDAGPPKRAVPRALRMLPSPRVPQRRGAQRRAAPIPVATATSRREAHPPARHAKAHQQSLNTHGRLRRDTVGRAAPPQVSRSRDGRRHGPRRTGSPPPYLPSRLRSASWSGGRGCRLPCSRGPPSRSGLRCSTSVSQSGGPIDHPAPTGHPDPRAREEGPNICRARRTEPSQCALAGQ